MSWSLRLLQIFAFAQTFAMTSYAFTLDTGNKIANTDGSEIDVQNAVNSASVVDGWTVSIPAGTFTWAANLNISGKGIHLKGAGAGRAIGRSTTLQTIGTGSKTFTTQSGLPITVGQNLKVERTGTAMNPATGYPTGVRTWMVGTVTTYSGTSLTLNITSTGGSGTHGLWLLITDPKTTVVDSANETMLAIGGDDSNSIEISGLRFIVGSPTGYNRYMITLGGAVTSKPTLIHDCYFETVDNFANIVVWTNRGIVWNTTFAAYPFAFSGCAFLLHNDNDTNWTTPSTMGMADSTGLSNFYIEDCDFHAYRNTMDTDGNSRTVIRHCLFDNAGLGSHGADSSRFGVRHYEYYNNEFIFNNLDIDATHSETFSLTWWFFLRGGTGVFTDNIIPDIKSSFWGEKVEFYMGVLNLNEQWDAANPCYGANIPGIQYPAPRQIGMGYVTGTGKDGLGRSYYDINRDPNHAPIYEYVGDSEPLYIWNNTGSYAVGYANGGEYPCTNPDSSSDYIVAGRDYFNNGTPKPGYTKYTYPHPLRSGITPPVTGTPHPADTNTDYLISLNEATTFGACWKTSCNANATLDNASRAGFLWKGSATGAYQYDSGATCPLCWEVKP